MFGPIFNITLKYDISNLIISFSLGVQVSSEIKKSVEAYM
jgi:hypothetical protein